MKKTVIELQKGIFLKLYSIFLFLGNSIYLYLGIYKARYIKNNGLDISSMHVGYDQYEDIANISKMTSFLEYLITFIVFIYLIYLVIAIVKKDEARRKMQGFLVLNFILLLILAFISYLISFIFSIPIGNVLQQLFGPTMLTFFVLIYFAGKFLYDGLSN